MRDLNDYKEQYMLNNPFEPYMVKYRRNNIIKYINNYKSESILEIGCGSEPLFKYLESFRRLVVIEPVKKFTDIASQFANNHKLNNSIKIINELFEGKTELIADFDFIVCAGLLHEIADPLDLVKSLYEVADKKSIVHVNVPNAFSFHRLLGVEAGIIKDVKEKSDFQKRFQVNRIFSMKDLQELVKSVGFEIIESGYIAFKPFTHDQMQKLLDKNILNEKIIDALAEMVKYCPEYGSEIYLNLKKNI